MKAAELHAARDLRIVDRPEPAAPGPHEALVAVRAVGVCGSDLHYWSDGRIGDTALSEPLIMGHEPAGEVLAVGSAVTHLQPGQAVAIDPALPCGTCEWCLDGHPNLCPHVRFFGSPPVDGALRERLVHPAEALFALPAGLSLADGALCEVLGVAVHAVDLGHLKPGYSAAVLGCGSVGLSVLQVARVAGAGPIYATDLLPERLAVARQLGAEQTCLGGTGDEVAALLEWTHGGGVDVVFDCATSTATPAVANRLARIGGTVVLVGIPPTDDFVLHHSIARRRGLTIRFARRMRAVYPRAMALAARGAVDLAPLATHRFPLDRAAEAFDLAETRRDGVIKAIIEL